MNAQARSSPLPVDLDRLFVDTPLRMTTVEFFAFTQHAERQYQLLNGRSMMNPARTMRHQRISRNLYSLLDPAVRANALGELWYAPCDVVLDRFNVVQPDLFFVAAGRAHIVGEKNVQGAPDLVIEILSATTADLDRGYKRHLYAAHGVREYWLVDPDARQVQVLALEEDGYATVGIYGEGDALASPLLGGLRVAIDDLFSGA